MKREYFNPKFNMSLIKKKKKEHAIIIDDPNLPIKRKKPLKIRYQLHNIIARNKAES